MDPAADRDAAARPSGSESARRSLNRRVVGAFLSIGAWAMVVRGGQASKDLIVAHDFGTGNVLDAFLVAFVVPTFVTYSLAAPFGDALLPILLRAEQRDRRDAQRLLASVSLVSVMGMAAVALLGLCSAGPLLHLVGSGLTPATLALAHSFFCWLMPAVVLSGLSAPWASALNAAGRYRITTCTPLAAPLITIVLMFTAERALGGYVLVLGAVLGTVVEAALLGIAVRRVGWRPLPRWHGADADLRRVVTQYAPLVAGSLLLMGTTVIDQSMAAMLGPHNVSALSYASKVVLAVMSAANLAVGTPIMTNVAQLVAAGDWPLIRRSLWSYTTWLAALTIPATAVLVWLSTPIVVLLFQRGSFTAADAQLVGRVQACYLLQVPFHLLGVLAVRFIMAMSYNRALMVITAVQVVVDVVANLVLMRFFGLAGIALSTSLVFALSMMLAYAVLISLLRRRTSPA